MNTKRKTTKPATGKRKLVAKFPEPADQEKADASAKLTLEPSVHGAIVALDYLKSNFAEELDVGALVASLEVSIQDLVAGDMKRAEAMLFGQATALQTIFTNLARRANSQQYLKHLETYLRLALKAQSQCRATLETLAAIKAGPVVIARQANIAHGPQQVNNGVTGHERAGARARAGETDSTKTELLGASDGERLDTGTASAAGRSDSALEAVGTIDGASN
jgi:hypothetical protein